MPALEVPLHYTRRVVLVRFERAVDSADPDVRYPDIDQRGERDDEHGGTFGVMVGRTVEVKVIRVQVGPRGPHLFAVSTRPDVLRVEGTGELASEWRTNVSVTGVSGGADSEDAKLEIHIGA